MREISRVIDTIWNYLDEGEDTLLEGWRTVTFEQGVGESQTTGSLRKSFT
jgi:hypothetical protein